MRLSSSSLSSPLSHLDRDVLSKRLFYLTAYSLTGAAVMGSSVGLVLYQSRQLFFLNRVGSLAFSSSSSAYTPPLIGLRIESDSNASPGSPATAAASMFQQFGSFVLSTWLPLVVWFLSLLSTSLLIKFQKAVPRILSPRTAILTSQAVFALFWIIFGGVQEVEEKVSRVYSGAHGDGDGDAIAGTETAQGALVHTHEKHVDMLSIQEQQEQALVVRSKAVQSLLVPLCVVWYAAVVLLGMATGLLTTSSTILERQLEKQYLGLAAQEVERLNEKCDGMGSEAAPLMDEDQFAQGKESLSWSARRSSDASANTRRYTPRQRLALGILVLTLFSSQMQFFQWIISHGSLSGGTLESDAGSSVSTLLTIFGLVSGTVMMTLGMRLIPADVTEDVSRA